MTEWDKDEIADYKYAPELLSIQAIYYMNSFSQEKRKEVEFVAINKRKSRSFVKAFEHGNFYWKTKKQFCRRAVVSIIVIASFLAGKGIKTAYQRW